MSLPKSKLRLRRLQADAYLTLSRIQRQLDRKVQQMFAAEGFEDVTPAQANVLLLLFQSKDPLTARELAREMSLSEVTVGRFVRSLGDAGWVVREIHPQDARAMHIRLTDKARSALPRLVQVSNALLDEAFRGFKADDIQRIAETVDKIGDNVRDPELSAAAAGPRKLKVRA